MKQNQETKPVIALGLDVDAKKAAVCAINIGNGAIEFQGNIPPLKDRWQKFLNKFAGYTVWACYEAGCTGFSLCRMLRKLGVDCQVVAPSAVPKAPTDRQVKNDRRDAQMLARLYINRPRNFVRIPTEKEENDRELIRCREQCVQTKVKTLSIIKSFLLFHNLIHPTRQPCPSSSKAIRVWIQGVTLSPSLRVGLNAHINTLENLEAQIKTLNASIAELSRTPEYSENCTRLLQIKGVGVLTAMTFLLEVFRPEDFPTAGRLSSHLGLTPSEYSSGGVSRRGHITHWGPPHVRRILVEAAWVWILKDENARRRYYEIRSGKERKRAIVAMARRLAVAMWAMTVKEQDYNYQWFENIGA